MVEVKLYKIKMWVIDLDKPEYEQFEMPPIRAELVLDKRVPIKHVRELLEEKFAKMKELLR